MFASNFRQNSIEEIFNNIGIGNILTKIKKSTYFVEYYTSKDMISENEMGKIPNQVIFARIDELADRRNDIAHGVLIDDILSLDYLLDELEFLKSFILSIQYILMQELEHYEFEYSEKIKISKVIKILNNKVLCCELSYQIVRIGDIIFSHNIHTNKVIVGRVISIEINNNKIQETPISERVTVGIELSTNIKENYDFYIKS